VLKKKFDTAVIDVICDLVDGKNAGKNAFCPNTEARGDLISRG